MPLTIVVLFEILLRRVSDWRIILDQTKELFGTVFHHDYDHHVTAACSQFGKDYMIDLRFFRF
jgi:hypothetical protein